MEKTTAWIEGNEDFFAGEGVEDNPWLDGTDESADWLAGWQAGESEEIGEDESEFDEDEDEDEEDEDW